MLCRRRAGRRDRHGASSGWERRSSEAQPQPCAHPSDTSRENGEHAAAVSSPRTPLGDKLQPQVTYAEYIRSDDLVHPWHEQFEQQQQLELQQLVQRQQKKLKVYENWEESLRLLENSIFDRPLRGRY